MKPIIGIMGAGSGCISGHQRALAAKTGKIIAEKKLILLTGAGLGIPLIAAKTAKSCGGKTIGISPAKNPKEHAALGFKTKPFSKIEFTGLGFIGRNFINIQKSDALIFIGGEHGTLNEFTIAYQQNKIIGILKGSGGITDLLPQIIKVFTRKTNAKIIIEKDPEKLMDKIFRALKSLRT